MSYEYIPSFHDANCVQIQNFSKANLRLFISLISKNPQLSSSWATDCKAWVEKYGDITELCPGGRLNKKDGLTRYGDSHVKDKTS